MESIKFCSRCGGLLEKGFLFCPYCGIELTVRLTAEEILEKPFRRLEVLARDASLRRLDGCEEMLDRLEGELDRLLAE